MMRGSKTVDAYIASFPKKTRAMLLQMRKTIRANAPMASEAMKYGMPTFVLGKNLVHFAAMKSHIGFYPTPSAVTAFGKLLTKYRTSKGAIQFPFDKALPLTLVAEIVRYRVKEVMGKSSTPAKKQTVKRRVTGK